MLINNCDVKLNRIPNYLLFEKPTHIVKPNIPQFFIQSQNRWVENPDHPDYIEGMQLYLLQKSDHTYKKLINSIILNDKSVLETKAWKLYYKRLKQLDEIEENEEYTYIKHFLLKDEGIKHFIVNEMCLTESRVSKFFESVTIRKFNEDINNVPLKHTINTGLSYDEIIIGNDMLVNPVDEWNVCVASNMQWQDWIENKYSLDTMAVTIAMFRLNKLMSLHGEDEQQTQMQKKNK